MIAVASDWLACRLACRLACLLARSLAYKFAAARQEHLTYGVYTHKESHRVKHHQNSGANYGQAVLGSCKLPHDLQLEGVWGVSNDTATSAPSRTAALRLGSSRPVT